ncbi:MAG: ASKHA domain-containing protein [Thiotrichales bacterium]|nr:ASKHA domain-containing protein [Thiotrichales bacterium]
MTSRPESDPKTDGQGGDALVVFTPSGRRGRFPTGTRILDAARALGVDLDSVCGGRGICGRCQVVQSVGEFAKHGVSSRAEHLSEFGPIERRYHEKRAPLAPGRRLGCSTTVFGDVVIDVPPDSQVHRQVVRKRAEVHAIKVDPVVRLRYVEVAPPDMHEPSGDLRRLEVALGEEWDLSDLRCDLQVLETLQAALRAGNWRVTVAVHGDRDIIAVWPDLGDRVYGAAVDIGSTTIAAHVCDLVSGDVIASAGAMNPQIRFGEDLMSRVSYVMMNPGGEREMTAAVRAAIRDLLREAAAQGGIAPDEILDVTLVGNPIMHHLLLGLNPVELGQAPFALTVDRAVDLPAGALDLGLHPGARAYVLPCVAGHVGADTAGVILSEAPYLRDEVSLVVDVGTNAEIVLGNRDRMLAASSPTGPAFEGAQISGGQRAAPGAIERVRIDPATLEPRLRIIGSDAWSDEPGFDAAAVTGICGSGIIEVVAEMYLAGILDEDGVIRADAARHSDRVVQDGRTYAYVLHRSGIEVRVTQNDVRAIQLAKAALYAGVRLLMDRLGVDRVDRIRLAGAFGSHIDVKYAMVLGLVPDCALPHVTSAGNAAGTGARIALLDRSARSEIERTVRRIEKIETAVEPRFQAHFVEAMAIPHKTAAYPELAKAVTLPARKPSGARGEGEGGDRRRRRRARAR